jgi:hypothetical protein
MGHGRPGLDDACKEFEMRFVLDQSQDELDVSVRIPPGYAIGFHDTLGKYVPVKLGPDGTPQGGQFGDESFSTPQEALAYINAYIEQTATR